MKRVGEDVVAPRAGRGSQTGLTIVFIEKQSERSVLWHNDQPGACPIDNGMSGNGTARRWAGVLHSIEKHFYLLLSPIVFDLLAARRWTLATRILTIQTYSVVTKHYCTVYWEHTWLELTSGLIPPTAWARYVWTRGITSNWDLDSTKMWRIDLFTNQTKQTKVKGI